MGSLKGTVTLVTGASRGIGKGCALELGAAGATVYVTGRTMKDGTASLPGSLEGTAAEIAGLGGIGIPVACDHDRDDEVEAVFGRVIEEHGRLDVLVNSAFRVPDDLDRRVPFWETPISHWDALINVGTRSAYAATVFAARIMVPQHSGLIVNVSSAGAIRFFHHVVYGVGKTALDRITKDAARPLRPHGVAIVSLWPHFVRTERVLRMQGFDPSGTESQRFTGRAIVALANDPEVSRWSGRALTTRGLAEQYAFTDLDGTLPQGSPWTPPA